MAFPGFRSRFGSSFYGSFSDTDHNSAAIAHDAADIHEVEADQTERMVRQVRCWASRGSLVLAFLIF
jgi:hypothetical protein